MGLPYIVAGSSEASCSVFWWTIYRPFAGGGGGAGGKDCADSKVRLWKKTIK